MLLKYLKTLINSTKPVIWKQSQLLFQGIQTEVSRSIERFRPGFLSLSTTGIVGEQLCYGELSHFRIFSSIFTSSHQVSIALPLDWETHTCLQALPSVPTRQNHPGLKTIGAEQASVLILTVQRVLKSKSKLYLKKEFTEQCA